MTNMTRTTDCPEPPLKHCKFGVMAMALALATPLSFGQTGGASLRAPADAAAHTTSGPMPVRVVCLAENVEDYFKNPNELLALTLVRLFGGSKVNAAIVAGFKSQFPPVGGWHYLPIGTGFIVDKERLHVVTNWHVALQCPRDEKSRLQIGIIEPSGNEITSILADAIEGRVRTEAVDGKGREVTEKVPVRALCRDREKSCSTSGSENVEFFAPDLAVLKLRGPAQTLPIPFASNLNLSGRSDLEIRGFPQVTMRLSQAAGGSRLQTVLPTLTMAKYSGPLSRDNIRPGVAQQDIVRAEMLMLAAQVHPGNSGGPVLANGSVVGVVTAAIVSGGKLRRAADGDDVDNTRVADDIVPAGYALAVPVAEVTRMLDWVGVKPAAAASLPPIQDISSFPPPEKQHKQEKSWLQDTQHQLMLGLALCLLVATAAFGVMISRRKAITTPAPVKPPIKPDTVIVPDPRPRVEPETPKPAPAVTPEKVRAVVELSLSQCPQEGQRLTLPLPNGANSLTVGRDPRVCQFVFPNSCNDVSGIHCSFTWNIQTAKLFVEDLRSTNFTFVNGRKLVANKPEQLKAGDTVDLGAEGRNRFSVRIL